MQRMRLMADSRPLTTARWIAPVVAALTLAACGQSSPTTAPSPSQSSVERQAAGEPEGDLVTGTLGTRVCIVNASSGKAYINFTKTNSQNDLGDVLEPDPDLPESCAYGKYIVGNDVLGTLDMLPASAAMEFWGNNPWAGAPGAGVQQVSGGSCAGYEGMSVGASVAWDDGIYKFTITRRADDTWKEFLIRVDDTAKPSADGKAGVCTNPGAANAA